MFAKTDLIDLFHLGMRYSHVAAGMVGLVLFWVPLLAKKGGKLHIRCGRCFTILAYYVGITALIASLWGLIHPGSFLVGDEWEKVTDQARPFLLANFRFMFAILGFLSLAILSGLVFGIRVIRTKHDHASLPNRPLLALYAAFGLWSLGLTIFGLSTLAMIVSGNHVLPAAAAGRYSIPIVLGVLGLLTTWSDVGYMRYPRPTPMAWWYKHMENMLGVGIGFYTAFFVFGAARILPFRLEGAWQLVPWVLPSLIGIPATHIWINVYKRRFGEADEKAQVTMPPATSVTVK